MPCECEGVGEVRVVVEEELPGIDEDLHRFAGIVQELRPQVTRHHAAVGIDLYELGLTRADGTVPLGD